MSYLIVRLSSQSTTAAGGCDADADIANTTAAATTAAAVAAAAADGCAAAVSLASRSTMTLFC